MTNNWASKPGGCFGISEALSIKVGVEELNPMILTWALLIVLTFTLNNYSTSHILTMHHLPNTFTNIAQSKGSTMMNFAVTSTPSVEESICIEIVSYKIAGNYHY